MKIPFLLSLILVLFGACTTSKSTVNVSQAPSPQQNANSGNKLTIDEKTKSALLESLADERRAQSFYNAIIKKFGEVSPFINIVQAEKKHEEHLIPLFQKYGVAIPPNDEEGKEIKVPESIADACKQGAEAEKINLEMYNRLLIFVKEQDIRDVFTWLRDASQNNHLPAFERCKQGGGRGRRYGRS